MPLMPTPKGQDLRPTDLHITLLEQPLPVNQKRLNQCIYCAAVGTSREHIIPRAFGGNRTLPKGSCKDCAEITKKFEDICARSVWGRMRVQLDYPSYDKSARPDFIEIGVLHEGEFKDVKVPVSSAPTLPIAVPALPIAGILQGRLKTNLMPAGVAIYDPKKCEMAVEMEKLGAIAKGGSFKTTVTVNNYAVARMLAKIAYAGAVAMFGLEAVPKDSVPYILGHDPCISHIVGEAVAPAVNKHSEVGDRVLFGILENSLTGRRYLYAWVELFNPIDAPGYGIVLGAMTREMDKAFNAKARTRVEPTLAALSAAGIGGLPKSL